jgi:hypothetical protein
MDTDTAINDLTGSAEIDYYEQEEESDDEIIIDQPQERKIIWQPKDFTLRELFTMKMERDLDLQPAYQRNFVFDNKKASRLIESILMDVPIPVIYIAEESNNKFSVIDGQQRLTSFLSYIEGKLPDGSEFKLSGLKILRELNKKKFDDLDPSLQTKIKTTALHTIIIKKESNEDIKFEIFERLNTGSIKLNEDEIRNSVYRGKYIALLKELADDEWFHLLVKKDNFKKRLIYRGMILRFLALSERTYLNYKPSIKQFCNKELRENRNLSEEKQEEYRLRFKKSVELCKIVFGENAFKRYIPGNSEDPNGKWVSSRINMALFDIEMCGFALYEKNQVVSHADEIREGLLSLLSTNEDFIRSIEIQTSDKEQVTKRFSIWLSFLDSVVSSKQPRTFPYEVKKQLFTENPTCGICNNQILLIEDAEVDHVDPFSRGGPTTNGNAQLAHRYCNRKKQNKI